MIMAFQICLMIIFFLSSIMGMGAEDERQQDRAAKTSGITLAALLITFFLMEGGFSF